METKAQAKYIRIAPRKVQIIIPTIKGKKVEEAISI
ncbi:MAG: 50S ribosomal protein L22, partial [Desulfobacca sp.]|nr:50S ribosomal protein L22 [Desulfobacca sp.]